MELREPRKFTVYYIVGQARTGSTFVADWIARTLNIPNIGEAWQTFRSLGLVQQEGFQPDRSLWARQAMREKKNSEILSHWFWEPIVKPLPQKPYESLLKHCSRFSTSLVDSSKTDLGIRFYKSLGCKVVIVHTIRAFTTWSQSMRNYQAANALSKLSYLRLILAYIRANRSIKKYKANHDYYLVPQEDLKNLPAHLPMRTSQAEAHSRYFRADIFGAPNFSETFDPDRSTTTLRPIDRLLLRIVQL